MEMTDAERKELSEAIGALISAVVIAPLYIRSASKILNRINPAIPKLTFVEAGILFGAIRMVTARPSAAQRGTTVSKPVVNVNSDGLPKELEKFIETYKRRARGV